MIMMMTGDKMKSTIRQIVSEAVRSEVTPLGILCTHFYFRPLYQELDGMKIHITKNIQKKLSTHTTSLNTYLFFGL